MNIKQAKDEIKNTVRAYLLKDETNRYVINAIRQRPIFMMGPPGVGKTQIIEQIARELRVGLVSYTITHHTRQSAVGLPFIKEKEFDGVKHSVTEYTMSEIIASVYEKMEETRLKEGILFIDEINCVSETLAPTMLQFLQNKTFGNQKVPQGWVIVTAGNPPEYNKSVKEFDMVTLDRLRQIQVEADIHVWREYAQKQQIETAILSYLELRPNDFYKVSTDVDGLQFVTARGWEDLSNLLKTYKQLEIPVTEEIIKEFLQHDEVAYDVNAYLELYKKYQDDYGIYDILQGKVKPQIYARIYEAAFDERVSVVNLLLDGLKEKIQKAAEEKYITDHWYEFLKSYRKELDTLNEPLKLYDSLVEEQQMIFENEKQGGFFTKEEEKRKEKLLEILRQTQIASKDKKEAFSEAKEGFDTQRKDLEELEKTTSKAIEFAFDFMEAAFEKGQEMVIFVTELTLNERAARFLAEHTSDRYLYYNKELLVGNKKTQLMSELIRDTI